MKHAIAVCIRDISCDITDIVISMITKITGMGFDEIDWDNRYTRRANIARVYTHIHTAMIIFYGVLQIFVNSVFPHVSITDI